MPFQPWLLETPQNPLGRLQMFTYFPNSIYTSSEKLWKASSPSWSPWLRCVPQNLDVSWFGPVQIFKLLLRWKIYPMSLKEFCVLWTDHLVHKLKTFRLEKKMVTKFWWKMPPFSQPVRNSLSASNSVTSAVVVRPWKALKPQRRRLMARNMKSALIFLTRQGKWHKSEPIPDAFLRELLQASLMLLWFPAKTSVVRICQEHNLSCKRCFDNQHCVRELR